ncbi:hypothetical protein [Mucilaginibacter sp.]|uniref:hypothetical protein n=1 Tax=Mucilaginibacter sp. TaxID=1882438 RepID=UPI003D115689
MNILELYRQSQFAKTFNHPDVKGVITVDGYSFDIRIVNEQFYCNGLPLDDFFHEGMFTPQEQLKYELAIENWLLKLEAA